LHHIQEIIPFGFGQISQIANMPFQMNNTPAKQALVWHQANTPILCFIDE
jgi:hypothetical protein